MADNQQITDKETQSQEHPLEQQLEQNEYFPDNNNHVKYNYWNIWSKKSENQAYKSFKKSIGDGEEKLAQELGVKVLGQNSSYDLNVGDEKWEVKKLDNTTFNSSKIGMNAYDVIKNKLGVAVDAIKKHDEFRLVHKTIGGIVNLNELCEAKCKRDGLLHGIFKQICALKKKSEENNNTVECFDIITGEKIKIARSVFHKRAIACGIADDIIKNKLGTYNPIPEHDYFDFPDHLLDDFDGLTVIYKGFILVVVDEEKGYFPITNPETKIKFSRITRGCPRFKITIPGI